MIMISKTHLFLLKSTLNPVPLWINRKGFTHLSKGFVPSEVEVSINEFWNAEPSFRNAGRNKTKFSMILPPPNVTGALHLGHALTTTVQDVMARRSSMRGDNVVWVPGLDHAGIATQAIVESILSASGYDTKEMHRDDLLERINSWKESKAIVIENQLKALAPSLDWTRQFFTLDSGQTDAVYEAFSCLYNDGLIYRAEKLVNWSVKLGSALSDMEVNYKQVSGPTELLPPSAHGPVTFGQMTDVSFKIHDRPGEEVVVSTCRLETMPGDVAVAVHPSDSRYSRYIDCLLEHPLTGKTLPIIMDSSVDPNFGTGAVKVTPGHDEADFDMASRHGLDVVSVIDEMGNLNSNAGSFAGLNRFEARKIFENVLKERGHIKRVRDHQMSLPICSRTGDVIELLSKPQWFIRCSDMGSRALEAVQSGHLEIVPDQYLKQWFSYLENIRDWCISRQVVWGHRIPLYTDGNGHFQLAARNQVPEDKSLYQVPDVLDTWFSSALLPFSAFGWPNNSEDLKKFFPLDIMVTGHDIVFFWVCRMVMLSLQLTDQLPFKKVLLHSVICDPQGRKMSKSLGNVIDPQHVIHGITQQELLKDIETRAESGALKMQEADLAKKNVSLVFPNGIPQCGVDALRLTLLSHKIKNHYIHFDAEACLLNKYFFNKLWQASRFTLQWTSKHLPDLTLDKLPDSNKKLDVWVLAKLINTVSTVNKSLDNFDFHIGVNAIKDFVHLSLCDVYLEAVKRVLINGSKEEARNTCYVLLCCLVNIVKLLAPMAPFVSEKLYQILQPHLVSASVHHSEFPTIETLMVNLSSNRIDEVDKEMSDCLNIIKEIRRLKLSAKEAKLKKFTAGILKSDNKFDPDLLKIVEDLSKCQIQILPSSVDSNDWTLFSTLSDHVSIFCSIEKSQANASLNFKSNEKDRKLMKLETELSKILMMTSHENYRTKVAQVVQKAHSDKILRLQVEIEKVRNQTLS